MKSSRTRGGAIWEKGVDPGTLRCFKPEDPRDIVIIKSDAAGWLYCSKQLPWQRIPDTGPGLDYEAVAREFAVKELKRLLGKKLSDAELEARRKARDDAWNAERTAENRKNRCVTCGHLGESHDARGIYCLASSPTWVKCECTRFVVPKEARRK